ncbi:PncC family amidohydrolase [Microcella alkaliphila]|uniref:PncC family amidohydrolase n=1 Tax=Microcella alkaliphila TaxID=279828 RepID=A0A4Q7TTM2_9MICO|nr:PncC family amidohydrolase [Microcella alkaliphila]
MAYRPESKFRALGVGVGPVVTETCARQMAWGVRRLLGADAAVAVTGVGGPGGSEGLPAGTVVIGVHARGIGTAQTHVFTGTPSEIVDQVVERALVALMARLRAH